ncbi:hypothetical protein Tco_1015702 [Tanacetum coccineum]|uniref:Uncharacterized protein n=1 Tax=Tanacetum coccineum TaxID=301880 RepID=A0ABQ5FP02_9ASTR
MWSLHQSAPHEVVEKYELASLSICVEPAKAIGAKIGHLIVAANVNSHGDILNLSIVSSTGEVCFLFNFFRWMYSINLWNADINTGLNVLQNEATIDLFVVEIQIHKQPLDAANYILIGIYMAVVKVFKTSSLQDCQPRLP